MAQTVKNILPQVPLDVIRRDLVITNNVDETITRLLDGTVFYDTEVEVLPPAEMIKAIDEESKKTEAKLTEIKEEEAGTEEDAKKEDKSADNQNTIKSEDLKTVSPMSFSTKAPTFEKDPQLRMKSYQERKQKLLDIARAHYIEKHELDKNKK